MRKEKEAKNEEKKKMKGVAKKGKKVTKTTVKLTSLTSSEEEDFDFIQDKSDDDLEQFLIKESDDEISFDYNQPSTSGMQLNTPILCPKKGEHVAACYANMWFIAKVIGTSSFNNQPDAIGLTYYHLEYLESKGANKFIWPQKVDEFPTLLGYILCVIDDPIPVSSRHIGLNPEDLKKVTKLYYNYLNRLRDYSSD